ncbi:MAG TPA: DUF1697 domain-containing protein [Solirubrobacteraceae bacterium]|nr:DUF1697 domain-containing protein [Solirubrobacteraceae bacterium]
MRQIALLRGINIGPRNRIAMPALRELLTSAGFEDVRTYVQSGNVVLSSDRAPERLAQELEGRIGEGFGLDIDVLVRTRDELAEVVRRNPLDQVAVDPKRYQVSFLEAELPSEEIERLAALAVGGERLRAIGRELYAWHPNGVARSRLWAGLADRALGVKATARNWATTTTLLRIADE